LVVITAKSRNPASHEYNVSKGITIRSVLSPKVGIRYSV